MRNEKIEMTEANKVFIAGEMNNWNSHADRVPETSRDLPDPPVVTKMVPCPPCTWG
jgi:hypothetical protein